MSSCTPFSNKLLSSALIPSRQSGQSTRFCASVLLSTLSSAAGTHDYSVGSSAMWHPMLAWAWTTEKRTQLYQSTVDCYSSVCCHGGLMQSPTTCIFHGRFSSFGCNYCPLLLAPHLALACRICRCLILVARNKTMMSTPPTSAQAAAAPPGPSCTASWRPPSGAACQSAAATLPCVPAPPLPARLSAACRCLPHACIHAMPA
jgi:hypothetical protein